MKEKVYAILKQQGVPYEVTEHRPVYTMEDMVEVGLDQLGIICKNLFIRDTKGKRHFIITANNDTKIDLKQIGERLGVGKVSFASADRLKKYLGVEAGCVSPFGVLNDETHSVVVVLDETLRHENRLGIHPNEHDATVWISCKALMDVLKANGTEVRTMKL